MSVAITVQQVTNALRLALDPDAQVRLDSLTQLQQAATTPGFYTYLVRIFSANDTDLGAGLDGRYIRLQAVTQFKNGVDKYWRRGAPNEIPKAEKTAIRPQLLAMVNEPDLKVSKTVALCIAKIARMDYGWDWDDLPESLVLSLHNGLYPPAESDGRIVLHRTLLFLKATIKSLSSNRIMKGRLLMQKVGNTIFPTLRDIYQSFLQHAVHKLVTSGIEASEEVEDLEVAVLAFKCLSKLIVYGCGDASADDDAKTFFSGTPATLSSLAAIRLQFIPSAPAPPPLATPPFLLLTKLILSHIKLYRALIGHDAAIFARMGVASEIIETVWRTISDASQSPSTFISDEITARCPERLVVLTLLLLKSTMGDWASESPVQVPEDFVRQFVEVLVTKLLPLRAADLVKWNEDPEEWMNEEEADRWEFELRPCSEHVLQSLLSHYKAELGPSMKRLLQDTSEPRNFDGLLIKEGVYCAFGRSSSDLRSAIPDFDFDSWLDQALAPEALGVDSNYRIIRRRIAWLVGKWVEEDLKPATFHKIYTLLVHLLGKNPSTDMAIRLTAARSLAKCGDTWDFDTAVFVPFLPSAMKEIVSLLREVTLPDSQMRLNQTLGVVIDRVQEAITPYAQELAVILAGLWASASGNPHFQTSVLVTLTKLAELCANEIFIAFEDLLGDLNLEPLKAVLHAMEAVFSTAPTLTWATALDGSGALMKIFKAATGIESAQIVTKCLLDLEPEDEETLPNALLTDLCTTSRIVLADPDTFDQLVQASSARMGCSPEDLTRALATQWIDRLDNMAQPSQRKLTALALGSLLPSARPVVLERLPEVVSLWSSVLAETEENEGGDAELYGTSYDNENVADDYEYADTLESARRQIVSLRDPIHSVKMIPFLREKLAQTQVLHGGIDAFQLEHLGRVDPAVLEEFYKRLQGQLKG
ncbi:importin-11, partial [Phenoliferia sp. Uapishka_3]